MKYCYNCGQPLNEKDNFCNHCGTKLNNVQGITEKQNIKRKKYKGSIIMGIVYVIGIISFLILFSSCQIRIIPS